MGVQLPERGNIFAADVFLTVEGIGDIGAVAVRKTEVESLFRRPVEFVGLITGNLGVMLQPFELPAKI